MTKRIPVLLVLLAILPALIGCQESPAANQPIHKLIITGSSTVAPLIADIGKRFEAQHPDIRVDVQTGGSSRGVADARSGIAHIGMASRALHPQETIDLLATTIAQDGIGLIVHADNPVANLTTQQVIDIYTGKVTNWQSLGGMNAPIVVVNKAEGRATLEIFLHHFHLANSAIKADVVIGDNEHGIKTVAGNPQAIAYVSIGTATYDATAGVPIKLLQLNSIPASLATVQNGTFPLSRPLTLVTTKHPRPLAQTFMTFATSPHVQHLVIQHSFIPLPS
ncbi:MAG: phosphate ABC transporter substrate-binding protein [Nitrospirae bacterium]|nr:phosphate ABC transporter substrate-binding protein [Nitrospirota bacterium]